MTGIEAIRAALSETGTPKQKVHMYTWNFFDCGPEECSEEQLIDVAAAIRTDAEDQGPNRITDGPDAERETEYQCRGCHAWTPRSGLNQETICAACEAPEAPVEAAQPQEPAAVDLSAWVDNRGIPDQLPVGRERVDWVLDAQEAANRLGGSRTHSSRSRCPFHGGESDTSMTFGNKADGTLTFGCFNPECVANGPGSAETMERMAGYLGLGGTFAARPPKAPAKPKEPRLAQYERTDRPLTVKQVRAAPVYFLEQMAAKKPSTFEWAGITYRSAHAVADEPLSLARMGGNVQQNGQMLRVLAWESEAQARRRLDSLRRERVGGADGFEVSMALTGKPDLPHPLAIGIIDVDYKPAKDETGRGEGYRDAMRAACKAAGMPMFASTSGNGCHALFTLGEGVWTLDRWVAGVEGVPGFGVDVFRAGEGRHVAVLWDRALTDEYVLPVLGRDDVEQLISEATRAD